MSENHIEDLIRSRLENTDRAYAILDAIKAFDGKRLDKRIIDKVAATTGEAIYRDDRYGMTHLVFRREGEPEFRFTIGHGKGVVIDAAWIENSNTCYLAAAAKRNEQRKAALADPVMLNEIQDAIDRYNQAVSNFNRLTDYDGPLGPDRYELKELLSKEL